VKKTTANINKGMIIKPTAIAASNIISSIFFPVIAEIINNIISIVKNIILFFNI